MPTTMTIRFDVDDGKLIEVLKNDKMKVRSRALQKLKLKGIGKHLGTVISSKASPDCVTYTYYGEAYQV